MELKAFTLAEVLITLGIVGVVAALTIPSLIQNHRKSIIETRLSKFYSTINQAIALSEIDNGDKKNWEILKSYNSQGGIDPWITRGTISPEDWYNKYLAQYIKVIKTEQSGVGDKKYNLYFPDGSMVTFSGSSWIFYPEAKSYKETTDEDGIVRRSIDGSGKNNFTFFFFPTRTDRYHNKGIEPYGTNVSEEAELRNDPTVGCKKEVTTERAYCTELIRRNGWKIPKDYPFKF